MHETTHYSFCKKCGDIITEKQFELGLCENCSLDKKED